MTHGLYVRVLLKSSKFKNHGADRLSISGFLLDLLFESNSASLIFEIGYFTLKKFYTGETVTINSTSGLANRTVSDFHHKQ